MADKKPIIEYLVSACPNGRNSAAKMAQYLVGKAEAHNPNHSTESNSLHSDDEYCRVCKTKLQKVKIWRCPYCGSENSMSNKKCSNKNYHWDDGSPCTYVYQGDCFITTATIQSLGKEDDCYELSTFRTFRDTYLKQVAPNLIEQYYKIAPKIVEKIDNFEDSNQIYLQIWQNYLLTCLKLIEAKKNSEAVYLYQKMVNNLSEKYLNLIQDEQNQL